eukprot:m.109001 g.109001  ORF g.109001 m.109001 type:complete len:64 (+) comp37332_c0_seq10:3079-3270(+)
MPSFSFFIALYVSFSLGTNYEMVAETTNPTVASYSGKLLQFGLDNWLRRPFIYVLDPLYNFLA